MTRLAVTLMSLSLLASACSHASQTRSEASPQMLSVNDIRMVAPALDKYSEDRLLGEVWKRPGLAPRDRSIVTLAALIARNQMIDMPYNLNLALDNGVTPREIAEIITHLAFYSGWSNAMSAVAVTKDIFAARKIGNDQLPPVSPQPLPLDEAAEAQRASRVGDQFGKVAPGVVQYTTDLLFRDLLAPSGPRAARPEFCDRQRTRRVGSSCADSLPPQPRDGQWADAAAGRRGAHSSGVLRRLAECVLGTSGGEGRFEKRSTGRP